MEVSISLDVFVVGIAIGAAIFFGLGAVAGSIETAAENFNEQYERWVDAQMPEPDDAFTLAIADELHDPRHPPGFDPFPENGYPDPTDADLASPRFEAIWQAIKGWDISRDNVLSGGYASPTGNDVVHILHALDDVEGPEVKLREALIDVRKELWVDHCLLAARTDVDPDTFNAKPVIRIIDKAIGAQGE